MCASDRQYWVFPRDPILPGSITDGGIMMEVSSSTPPFLLPLIIVSIFFIIFVRIRLLSAIHLFTLPYSLKNNPTDWVRALSLLIHTIANFNKTVFKWESNALPSFVLSCAQIWLAKSTTPPRLSSIPMMAFSALGSIWAISPPGMIFN